MFSLPKIIVVVNICGRVWAFLFVEPGARNLPAREQPVKGEAGKAAVLEIVPRQRGALGKTS